MKTLAIFLLGAVLAFGQSSAISSIDLSDNGPTLRTKLNDNFASLQERAWNVKDYGAVGDGVTDDTAAFKATRDAIQAAATALSDGSSWKGTMPTLYIPAGRYLLTEANCLCPTTTPLRGFRVIGEGVGTQLRVSWADTGEDYLCDNHDKFSFAEFQDFSVYSVNGTEKGFHFYGSNSGSQPSMITIRNVRLQNVKYGIVCDGDNWLADRMLYEKVQIVLSSTAGAIGYLVQNNNNSVVHTFLHCEFHALNAGNVAVRFTSGGILNVFSGSLIVDGAGSIGFDILDDPLVAPNLIDGLTSTFSIYGIKPEIRVNGALLYHMNARAILTFYDVHAVTGYATGGVKGQIEFAGHARFIGGRNWYTHELVTDNLKSLETVWYRPTVTFDNVGIKDRLEDMITVTHTGSSYAQKGRAECHNCFRTEDAFQGDNNDSMVDGCINCERGHDGRSWKGYVGVFRLGKNNGDGLPSSADSTNQTFVIPEGKILKRLTVVKIQGGTATSGVLTISAAGGSTIYTSPTWTQNTATVATIDGVDYYCSASDRTFTVSSTSSERLYGYITYEYF